MVMLLWASKFATTKIVYIASKWARNTFGGYIHFAVEGTYCYSFHIPTKEFYKKNTNVLTSRVAFFCIAAYVVFQVEQFRRV